MAQRRTEKEADTTPQEREDDRTKREDDRITCKSCQYQYYDRSLIMPVKENKTIARTRTTAHDNFIYRFANVVPGPPPPERGSGGRGAPPEGEKYP